MSEPRHVADIVLVVGVKRSGGHREVLSAFTDPVEAQDKSDALELAEAAKEERFYSSFVTEDVELYHSGTA